MALEENNGLVMPVAPMYGGSGGGFGNFGGDGWWILLLLLFAGGGFGNGFGGFGGDGIYPWLNNSQNINDGFRDQMLNSSVSGIQSGVTSGFGDIQTALCGGFAGVNASITNAQMASMNQAFANQNAMNQGFNSVTSQLSQCCCDNKMLGVTTQNIVQSEGAATRLAIQNQTQAILDKMCQQELDAYRRENDNLRTQINMLNLSASQARQTAELIADNTAQTQYIVNRVAPYPIPAYTVANPVTPATT